MPACPTIRDIERIGESITSDLDVAKRGASLKPHVSFKRELDGRILMPAPQTLGSLLERRESSSVALLAQDGVALLSREVLDTVNKIAGQLAAAGIARDHRVAIAVRNGPMAALAFLGAATAGVAAPLNPAYTRNEFEFSMRDLPAALLLTDGTVPDASAAAYHLGLREMRLGPGFVAEGLPWQEFVPAVWSDVALVLHTSGTTARPKRVPLTHANLTHSARNIAASLQLSPEDRCLNLMPLFHIHGLVAALLATLSAGGLVACAPGFDAFRVFGWLEALRPTWYTAVPTVHQAILRRGTDGNEAPLHRLRFVRSSSSALPGTVARDLEARFGVPVIEAYGMTEASHRYLLQSVAPGRTTSRVRWAAPGRRSGYLRRRWFAFASPFDGRSGHPR